MCGEHFTVVQPEFKSCYFVFGLLDFTEGKSECLPERDLWKEGVGLAEDVGD